MRGAGLRASLGGRRRVREKGCPAWWAAGAQPPGRSGAALSPSLGADPRGKGAGELPLLQPSLAEVLPGIATSGAASCPLSH